MSRDNPDQSTRCDVNAGGCRAQEIGAAEMQAMARTPVWQSCKLKSSATLALDAALHEFTPVMQWLRIRARPSKGVFVTATFKTGQLVLVPAPPSLSFIEAGQKLPVGAVRFTGFSYVSRGKTMDMIVTPKYGGQPGSSNDNEDFWNPYFYVRQCPDLADVNAEVGAYTLKTELGNVKLPIIKNIRVIRKDEEVLLHAKGTPTAPTAATARPKSWATSGQTARTGSPMAPTARRWT